MKNIMYNYVNKLENMGKFGGTNKTPKLAQETITNMNRLITSK